MKKQKNMIIFSDGSVSFSCNKGVLFNQSKILFCQTDCQNFSFNQKKVTKNFEYSKLSNQSKKYFN